MNHHSVSQRDHALPVPPRVTRPEDFIPAIIMIAVVITLIGAICAALT